MQLYPIPLLSSCMHAIKTIAELQDEYFGELDLSRSRSSWKQLEASRIFRMPLKIGMGIVGTLPNNSVIYRSL